MHRCQLLCHNQEIYIYIYIYINEQGVAINGGLEGPVQIGTFFCIVSTKRFKIVMFLHHVNNIEHNLKQNIYTGMEVISLIPPRY